MRVAIIGTRGFPNVQGGVEAHCENLCPRLAKLGCEVTVFGRKPYLKNVTVPIFYEGVKIIPLACRKSKFLEAFSHTFSGLFAAKKINPDIVHIHAIGPSLMVPLARLLGMKVVMTHHGPDYERKKWGRSARAVLRIGEAFGVRFADAVICISGTIASGIKKRYGRDAVVIPNGVAIPEILSSEEALKRYGLEKDRYILAIGRFVPEKGFHDLAEAFDKLVYSPQSMARSKKIKLVIVGAADHEDEYSRGLRKKAAKNPNIALTGFLSGKPLQELYSHAGLFVLPSYYEGLPIVLLEAMSYGLSCVVSDIPANREVGLQDQRYFKPGDVRAMSAKIAEFIDGSLSEEEKRRQIETVRAKYNWDDIARKTFEVYKSVCRSL